MAGWNWKVGLHGLESQIASWGKLSCKNCGGPTVELRFRQGFIETLPSTVSRCSRSPTAARGQTQVDTSGLSRAPARRYIQKVVGSWPPSGHSPGANTYTQSHSLTIPGDSTIRSPDTGLHTGRPSCTLTVCALPPDCALKLLKKVLSVPSRRARD